MTKTVTPSGGTAQATQYAYDADNRLAGVALPIGGRSAYEYDANGLQRRGGEPISRNTAVVESILLMGCAASGIALAVRRIRRKRRATLTRSK